MSCSRSSPTFKQTLSNGSRWLESCFIYTICSYGEIFFLYCSYDSSTPTKWHPRAKLERERERWVERNNVLGESRNCHPRPLPIQYLTCGLAMYNQLLATIPLNPRPPTLPIFSTAVASLNLMRMYAIAQDFVSVSAA